MLFSVTIAVYSGNYWNYVTAVCRYNEDFLIIKHVLPVATIVVQKIKMCHILSASRMNSYSGIPLFYLHYTAFIGNEM
jgi:hypothetical protein